jgi:hypothetical protein
MVIIEPFGYMHFEALVTYGPNTNVPLERTIAELRLVPPIVTRMFASWPYTAPDGVLTTIIVSLTEVAVAES